MSKIQLRKSHYFGLICCLMVFACKQSPLFQGDQDRIPPGAVTNVQVTNIPGGAVITYTNPKDEDLLYVKAVYPLKEGVICDIKASRYTDTIKIEGFGDMQERQVSLIAVDGSNNESLPVITSVKPLEAPVMVLGKTLRLTEEYGGVHAYWENPTNAEVFVVVLKEDNNKEYVPIETFSNTKEKREGVIRNLGNVASRFGIYAKDRWGNQSDIKYYTLTPFYEVKFDRSKFGAIYLYGDEHDAWGWVMTNMWNGEVGDEGFHTNEGFGRWPQSFTMDLGVTGKIHRLKLWQRTTWLYARGNPMKFQVWGCETLDPTGSWSSWTKLTDCESIKPSGLPLGQNSNDDTEYALGGEEYFFPTDIPKVRYLRFLVTQVWGEVDFVHISEIEFWGDNR